MNLDTAAKLEETQCMVYLNRARSVKKMSEVPLLPNTEDPVRALIAIKKLSVAIDAMYFFTEEYNLHGLWNYTVIDDKLKEIGVTVEWFDSIAAKLEELRSILVGNSLDYDELVETLQEQVLCHEYYMHLFYEDETERMRREKQREAKNQAE